MSRKRKSGKKLNTAEIARHLGASAVYPLNPNGLEGLEIIFCRPVRQTDDGGIVIVGSGAVFPTECVAGFDLDRSTIVLSVDYQAWYNLSTGTVLFMSSAPNRPQVRVRINKISSINKLPSGLNLLPLIY